MAIFAVFGANQPIELQGAIEREFEGEYLQVGDGQWLVAASGKTASDVSDTLGVTDGTNGRAIVATIGNYWGRHTKDTWEWMKVKMERHGG